MQFFVSNALRLSLLIGFGFLAGCIPAPMGKYYKPIYPDASAKYIGDECYGHAGAPATLSFIIADGVIFNITTIRTYGEKDRIDRPLRISIGVPTGTQIQFLSKEIFVSSSLQDKGKSISPDINIAASVIMDSNEIVDFSKIAPSQFFSAEKNELVRNFSAATWLSFSWKDNFVPSAFSMEIPPIQLIDSMQDDHVPIVLLAKAKKRLDRYPGQYKSQTSLIYSTSESESALTEKYAKCISEKPEAKCENILIYDEAAFKVEKNGFNYSGRWYVYDVERRSPFNGEIKIEFENTFRWKFASNKVTIVESSSKVEKVYAFDRFPLRFNYEVPINTPIRGVNNQTSSKTTTISINSSLGTEELPRYFIKMPPVLINGKQYEIAPIELEKRMLDFGLEPFNC